jgi:hypothetical protein
VEPSPQPPAASANGTSYSSYRTAEERAAYIKQQAEQKMAERLAALGIKPASTSSVGETTQQRLERQRKEQQERLRKAEEEDARREQERQRKLEGEQIVPPSAEKAANKKPPPPPSRKNKAEAVQPDVKRADTGLKQAEHDRAEQAIHEQQDAQAAELRAME